MRRAVSVVGPLSLLVLLSLFSPRAALGSPPSAEAPVVEAALTQTNIRVGDQAGLQISVTHHFQTVVEFPTLYDKLGVPEVLAMKPLPSTRYLNGIQVSVMEYTITGFIPGHYLLPPIAVGYVDPQGQRGTVETTQDLVLEVASVLANLPDETLRDIKPPLSIPKVAVSYLYTASLLALTVGVLGVAALLYRRWPRHRGLVTLMALRLGPEEGARQELNRIPILALLEHGEFPTYYSLISSSIRRYLDTRLELDALGSTTQELHRTMQARGLDRWQARVVTGLLEECDAAKWAQYRPAMARAQRALTLAFEIIDLVEEATKRPAISDTSMEAVALRRG